ncbi:signal peptidase I, partial [Dietzia cinnamea]|uniref:signal peptidase I n=1 Tax=Dietzia cinnamea TaxID=321318 RepID=UPI0021A4EC95
PGPPARGVEKKGQPWYIEIPLLVVIALALVFVFQTFVGRVYQIPSESMEPTLHGCAGCTGDRIFVDKISYRFGDPRPGDVVVFEGPESWNEGYQSIRSDNPVIRTLQNIGGVIGIVPPDQNDMVKRVIAVGGQTVGGCAPDGSLLVDGKPLDEPYLNEDPSPARNPLNCAFGPVTVPEGNYWVMGDNRGNSADSRFHMGDEHQGTVPAENIIGKVQAIILPFDRIGTVSSPDISAG